MKITVEAQSLEELLQISAELLKRDGATILKTIPEAKSVPEEIMAPEPVKADPEPVSEKVEEEVPVYTDVQMRKMLADLNKKHPDDKPASGLIKKLGYGKFSDVPAEKYAELAELVANYAAD